MRNRIVIVIVSFTLFIGSFGGCKQFDPLNPLKGNGTNTAPAAPIPPVPPTIKADESILTEFDGWGEILDSEGDKIVIRERDSATATDSRIITRIWWISTTARSKELVTEFTLIRGYDSSVTAATDGTRMTVVWQHDDDSLRRVSYDGSEKREGALLPLPNQQRRDWEYVDAVGNVVVGVVNPTRPGYPVGGTSHFALWENDWGVPSFQLSASLGDVLESSWWSGVTSGSKLVQLTRTNTAGIVILETTDRVGTNPVTSISWTRSVLDLITGTITALPAELGQDELGTGPSVLSHWWVNRETGSIYWQRQKDAANLFMVDVGNPTAITTIPLPSPLYLAGGNLRDGFWGNVAYMGSPYGIGIYPERDRFFTPANGTVWTLHLDYTIIVEGAVGSKGLFWIDTNSKKIGLITFRP